MHPHLVNLYFFLGQPTGYDEVWVIGETHVLSQARMVLLNMKELDNFSGHNPRQRLPYLLDNYEVITSPYHHSWSFTTQIKGGFNHLLSSKWRLPNYILIIFSNKQIQDVDILGDGIHEVIMNLFTSIARAITERKDILPKKARRFKPPQIIVIRTLPKLDARMKEGNFKFKRRTLNRVLQRLASDFQWNSINIDAILPSCDKHFDESGHELSEEGFRQMWMHISQTIQDYDAGPERGPITSPKFHYRAKTHTN